MNFDKCVYINGFLKLGHICDPILENHTSRHMQNLWEFSIENLTDFFKIHFFTYSDKATIKPSCCEISHP